MGDLHLVLPALNLSTLNAGILIIMQQVRLRLRLMMFSINMVDCSMSFLLLSKSDQMNLFLTSCCPPEIFFWLDK
mgnify:CR=1 FL=1